MWTDSQLKMQHATHISASLRERGPDWKPFGWIILLFVCFFVHRTSFLVCYFVWAYMHCFSVTHVKWTAVSFPFSGTSCDEPPSDGRAIKAWKNWLWQRSEQDSGSEWTRESSRMLPGPWHSLNCLHHTWGREYVRSLWSWLSSFWKTSQRREEGGPDLSFLRFPWICHRDSCFKMVQARNFTSAVFVKLSLFIRIYLFGAWGWVTTMTITVFCLASDTLL